MKIRNDEDKTILEIKIEKEPKKEKIKPSAIFGIILIILAAVALSVLLGYLFFNLKLHLGK